MKPLHSSGEKDRRPGPALIAQIQSSITIIWKEAAASLCHNSLYNPLHMWDAGGIQSRRRNPEIGTCSGINDHGWKTLQVPRTGILNVSITGCYAKKLLVNLFLCNSEVTHPIFISFLSVKQWMPRPHATLPCIHMEQAEPEPSLLLRSLISNLKGLAVVLF